MKKTVTAAALALAVLLPAAALETEAAEKPKHSTSVVAPRPAPRFKASRLGGGKAGLEDYRGKVVLLDFWATWCQPCVKSMPELQKLHDRLSGQGFSVVGVSIDTGKKAAEKVRDFVAARSVGYPILLDDGGVDSAMTAFDVGVVPTLFLIDAQGRIVGRWVGEADLEQVEAEIAKHLRAGSAAR